MNKRKGSSKNIDFYEFYTSMFAFAPQKPLASVRKVQTGSTSVKRV